MARWTDEPSDDFDEILSSYNYNRFPLKQGKKALYALKENPCEETLLHFFSARTNGYHFEACDPTGFGTYGICDGVGLALSTESARQLIPVSAKLALDQPHCAKFRQAIDLLNSLLERSKLKKLPDDTLALLSQIDQSFGRTCADTGLWPGIKDQYMSKATCEKSGYRPA